MTSVFSIEPGRAYKVLSVRGEAASDASNLLGPSLFVIDLGGAHYTVRGEGALKNDVLRFREKTKRGTGTDIREWTIGRGADRTLTATTRR